MISRKCVFQVTILATKPVIINHFRGLYLRNRCRYKGSSFSG